MAAEIQNPLENQTLNNAANLTDDRAAIPGHGTSSRYAVKAVGTRQTPMKSPYFRGF